MQKSYTYMHAIEYMYENKSRRKTMKATLIALATVIGLSGGAFAMDNADKGTPAPVAPKTDVVTTNSTNQGTHNVSVPVKEGYASKAGIDVNPNFLPGL